MKIFNVKNYAICLVIPILLTCLRIIDPFFIETARLKGLDYYQNNQEKVKSENIAIIEIDEDSLDEYGQWPWKRDLIAQGIIKAYESGAQLVVVPILFAEKDRLGGDQELIELLNEVPVIIGQSASTKGKGDPVPRGLATIGESLDGWLFDYPEAIGPVKELGEVAAGVGMVLTAPELDGVVRRMPLVIQIKSEAYPTIPLEVIRLFSGEQSYQAKVNEAGVEAIRVPGFDPILTDENSRVWINFKYEFDKVSFKDADWSVIEDKIAVIGITGEGLANTIATSTGISYGHEVNCHTLQMIIDENRLERNLQFYMHELIITASICSIIIIGALWLPYFASLAFCLISVTSLPWIGTLLFEQNKLYDFTWPLFTIFTTWSAATFVRFVQENKTKKLIKNQFEHYLSPSVVKLLQKNPNQLQLGGNTRELTILFSDLRDFTTLSEQFKSNPQELTDLINKYLTPMTGCVIDNSGTVDKFIGDALMAFWNAPVADVDHRYHSVKCALEMFELLKELNKELEEKGIELKMGIGVNTGDVVVGNMGSNQRFDYTCLGDAVNLAARLESQTKGYKVGLLIGDETRQALSDRFSFCELDMIAVKGKTEGVRIHTIVTKNRSVPNHETFLDAYRSKKWSSAIKHAKFCKKAIPELSGYYDMMIERINYLEENEPGENWDTVFRATSK